MISLAFTTQGKHIAEELEQLGIVASSLEGRSLHSWTEQCFQEELLVFIGATGIAVRALAPFIKGKDSDPAVLVIDEGGRFVISLLSGHLGGANAWAEKIAAFLGATPVITTATEGRGLFSVDRYAKEQGFAIKPLSKIKDVSMKLLEEGSIRVSGDVPLSTTRKELEIVEGDADLHVGYGKTSSLQLIPPCLILGVGCRKGTGGEALEAFFTSFMEENGIHEESVVHVVSHELKKEEEGLHEFAKRRGLSLSFYTTEVLNSLEGEFSHSAFVESITGVDCVCERSAMMLGDQLIVKKTTHQGMTLALAVLDKEYILE